MAFIDYYKILGIAKNANEKDIKAVYRKLARKYHPDLNPNNKEAEARFKEINEANEVLSDPEKRKKYDEYGNDWKHADEIKKAQQQQHSKTSQQNDGSFKDDFSQFFQSMYGQSGNKNRQTTFRGQDVNATLQLNLKDVYTTHKQTITINGKNVRITIPAGVENEQVLKLSGHGTAGVNGGPAGDLYVTFLINNQSNFKREGNHLYSTAELDLYTALLGGEAVIDTFEGKVKLKVAPETQSGTKVKLKGKGFPVYKKENEFGDFIVTYQIKLPTALSEKEKELLTQLQKIRHHGNQ